MQISKRAIVSVITGLIGMVIAFLCTLMASAQLAAYGLAGPGSGPPILESAVADKGQALYVVEWTTRESISWEALARDRGLSRELAQESFKCSNGRDLAYDKLKEIVVPRGSKITLVLRQNACFERKA